MFSNNTSDIVSIIGDTTIEIKEKEMLRFTILDLIGNVHSVVFVLKTECQFLIFMVKINHYRFGGLFVSEEVLKVLEPDNLF
jgi:hypothetical protein